MTQSDYYTITTKVFCKAFARTLVMLKFTHLLMSDNVANVTRNLYASSSSLYYRRFGEIALQTMSLRNHIRMYVDMCVQNYMT